MPHHAICGEKFLKNWDQTKAKKVYKISSALDAAIAQLVEQLTCNQQVPGSKPGGGTT